MTAKGRAAEGSVGRRKPLRWWQERSKACWCCLTTTQNDQTASLKLPARYLKATDLHTGTNRPVVSGAVQLTVPFQVAMVLLLE